MALILNIDSSTEQASVCVAENAQSLGQLVNTNQKEHSSWLHIAIQEVMEKAGKTMTDLSAVAVTAGPGSYTGIRVSMATAKGLCYALNKPLIAVNTLEAMASMVKEVDINYICPMIDARRMEVFTALYDKSMNLLLPPCAMILEDGYFTDYLEKGRVLFFGNGSEKWKAIQHHPNAVFKQLSFTAVNLAVIADQKALNADFALLAYIEPVYIKDFYIPN